MAQRKNGSTQSKGKKGRKHGRMKKKVSHMRYNSEKRYLKNKARRIVRKMKKFSNYHLTNMSDDLASFVKKYLD